MAREGEMAMVYSPRICREAKESPHIWGLPEEAKRWTLKVIKKVLEETHTSEY